MTAKNFWLNQSVQDSVNRHFPNLVPFGGWFLDGNLVMGVSFTTKPDVVTVFVDPKIPVAASIEWAQDGEEAVPRTAMPVFRSEYQFGFHDEIEVEFRV